MDEIHVIYAFNNAFAEYAATSIISLLENNKNEKINLHIFHIDTNGDSLNKISLFLKQYSCKYKFYEVNEELFDGFPPTGQYSLACYLRLLTPSLLPNIDKALYLDSDTIVLGSIRELWDMDIKDCSLAACYDSTMSKSTISGYMPVHIVQEYFNSGMLLMNLAYWRSNKIEYKLCKYLQENIVKLPDQDALNYILDGTVKLLHPKWNALSSYFTYKPRVPDSQLKYIPDLWRSAKIIHFIGMIKPWHYESAMAFKGQWKKYHDKTPWRNSRLSRLKSNITASILAYFINWVKYSITVSKSKYLHI